MRKSPLARHDGLRLRCSMVVLVLAMLAGLGGGSGFSSPHGLGPLLGPAPAPAAAAGSRASLETLGPARSVAECRDKTLKCFNANNLAHAEGYSRALLTEFGPLKWSDKAWGLYWLARSLEKQRRFGEAYAVIQQRMAGGPLDQCGLAEFALLAYHVGDWETAKRCVEHFDTKMGRPEPGMDTAFKRLRDSLQARRFRIVYERYIPGKQYIPLPLSDLPYQKLLSWKVENAAWHEYKVEPYFGDPYIEAESKPDTPIRLTVEFTQTPYSFKGRLKNYDPGPLPADVSKLLGRSFDFQKIAIDPAGEVAAPLVKQLKGRNAIESIENVLRYCDDVLFAPGQRDEDAPDYVAAWSDGTSERCLRAGTGHCEGTSRAYAALLRGCGVPARLIRGELHAIPEFYVHGVGWIDYQPLSSLWAAPLTFYRKYHYDGEQRTDGVFSMPNGKGGVQRGCMAWDMHGREEVLEARYDLTYAPPCTDPSGREILRQLGL